MPGATSTSSESGLRLLLAVPLVVAWAWLLAVPSLQPGWLAGSSLARFAPLGFLAVFVFPDRSLRLTRLLLVAVPAAVLGTFAAAVALAWRAGESGLPGPSDLLLPALAVVAGVVLALAWRRGPFALLLLPFKLAFLAALAIVLAVVLLFTRAEREPAVGVAPPVTSEEQQQLSALFRDTDPWSLASGEVRTLRLSQRQLDRLAAWLLPRLVDRDRARLAIVLGAEEAVELRASLALPFSRWLNATGSARVEIAGGRLDLRRLRLRLGRTAVPDALAEALAPPLSAAISAERPLRPVLAAIREIHVEADVLRVSFGPVDAPRGPIAELLWGRRS